jgi:hypothetical protein
MLYHLHSACYEDARAVADLIEARFPHLNGKVLINYVGTTIGSHTGPGTVPSSSGERNEPNAANENGSASGRSFFIRTGPRRQIPTDASLLRPPSSFGRETDLTL